MLSSLVFGMAIGAGPDSRGATSAGWRPRGDIAVATSAVAVDRADAAPAAPRLPVGESAVPRVTREGLLGRAALEWVAPEWVAGVADPGSSSAHPIGVPPRTAAPTPRATANPPTRPTYVQAPMAVPSAILK